MVECYTLNKKNLNKIQNQKAIDNFIPGTKIENAEKIKKIISFAVGLTKATSSISQYSKASTKRIGNRKANYDRRS